VTTARDLLNDARVTVMVRDGNDITTVSSPTRTIPTKLRRALEARYPTCGRKTCANDRFLQIDHVIPVEEGGETRIDNTWRLCPHDHHLKTHWAGASWASPATGTSSHPTTPTRRDGDGTGRSRCHLPP
jgi:5-methylcytosine-specific restriction endonuclease McrA